MSATVVSRGIVLHHTLVLALLALSGLACLVALETLIEQTPPWDERPAEHLRAAIFILGLGVLASTGASVLWLSLWIRGRWRDASLAPFRAAIYVTVGGWVAYLAVQEDFHRADWLFAVGGAAGVFSLILIFSALFVDRRPRRLLRALDLVLFNLSLIVLLTEGGLRTVAWFSASPIFVQAEESVLDRLARFRMKPGEKMYHFPMDSRGYHDEEYEKKEGDVLVCSIGDSFSVGIVPHYFHFTTVSERLVPELKIYNMGVNATGPVEYKFILEAEALPLEPQAVLISLFLGNDVSESKQYGQADSGLRALFDRSNILTWLVPQRLFRIARERQASAEGILDQSRADQPIALLRDPRTLIRAWPWLADPLAEKPTRTHEASMTIEKNRLWQVFRPLETAYYTILFEVIAAMRSACGDTPFLVLLIPAEIQIDDPLWQAVKAEMPDGVILDRELPQKLVTRWLGEQGIPYLDLLPVFKAVPPLKDGSRHLYHSRDTHINTRGNKVAGEALAEFLRTQLPLHGVGSR